MKSSNQVKDDCLNLNLDQHRPNAFFGIKTDESKESVRDWVKWCKHQGFGGFNMIIATECDGTANERWLDQMLSSYRVALETAREENLKVWIFDDWGYPSGTAGGLVCTEPSYRLKKLVLSFDCILHPYNSITIELPSTYLAAGIFKDGNRYESLDLLQYKVDSGDSGQEDNAKNAVQYIAGNQEERLVVVSWDYDKHSAKSNCKSYPGDPAMSCIDMLNPKATQRFLEVMHERYYHNFVEYFGNVIQGFFYDEPYVSYPFPWTRELPQEFTDKYGYCIVDYLPLIMVNGSKYKTGENKQYLDDYFEICTDMVAKNYYGVLSKWCKAHGVELAGHMDLDNRINTLSTISGHFYKNMAHNDRPAIDVIWAQIEPGVFTDYPRYAGSVRRLEGLEHATSETFAGMGQGLFADYMRYVTDHQVIRGINDFHLMYSNNAPDESGYLESPQMPNHMLQKPFGRLIYERIARASTFASIGQPVMGTALYIPARDIFREQLALKQDGVPYLDKQKWEWVNEIAEELSYMPIDFDYVWEQAIDSLEIVSGGLLTKSGYVIHTIILPPACSLSDRTVNKLKAYKKAGGQIISVFDVNWGLEKEAVICNRLKELSNYVDRQITVFPQSRITIHIRREQNRTFYLLLNEDSESRNVQISINDSGTVYDVDLSNGSMQTLGQMQQINVQTFFEERQMKIFVVDKTDSITNDYKIKDTTIYKDKKISIDKWRIELPDKKQIDTQENIQKDWCMLGYPTYSGKMKYYAEFEWNKEESSAILKIPELRYHAIVELDGAEVGKMIFTPYELKLNNLSKGKHQLIVTVYNTAANAVCGTFDTQREKYSKRFARVAPYDRRNLKSGMFGVVTITPCYIK